MSMEKSKIPEGDSDMKIEITEEDLEHVAWRKHEDLAFEAKQCFDDGTQNSVAAFYEIAFDLSHECDGDKGIHIHSKTTALKIANELNMTDREALVFILGLHMAFEFHDAVGQDDMYQRISSGKRFYANIFERLIREEDDE